jgi:hypothetical protein
MPLFYQQDINPRTRLALWRITEGEAFFLDRVPLAASGIGSPQKRLQHLAARHLLQVLEPDFPYADVRIESTGRPCLPDDTLDFSVSHAGDMAAAILGRPGHVGIDVEWVTPRVERVMPRFLHPDERVWVEGRVPPGFAWQDPELARWLLPTLLWSAKETVYKWQGQRGVEFEEQIRFEPFDLASSGEMAFRFLRDGDGIPLTVGYRIEGRLCLTWLSAPRAGLSGRA